MSPDVNERIGVILLVDAGEIFLEKQFRSSLNTEWMFKRLSLSRTSGSSLKLLCIDRRNYLCEWARSGVYLLVVGWTSSTII